MVKVIERTPKEIALSEKFSQLEQIARKFVDEKNICLNSNLNSFSLYKNSILVIPELNRLFVYDSQQFDFALDLANLYENTCNEEFIIKKEYKE